MNMSKLFLILALGIAVTLSKGSIENISSIEVVTSRIIEGLTPSSVEAETNIPFFSLSHVMQWCNKSFMIESGKQNLTLI